MDKCAYQGDEPAFSHLTRCICRLVAAKGGGAEAAELTAKGRLCVLRLFAPLRQTRAREMLAGQRGSGPDGVLLFPASLDRLGVALREVFTV